MNCANCGRENPEDANYCHNCGQLLTAGCPRCHNPVLAAAHFCHRCGLPLSPQGQNTWWDLEDADYAIHTARPSVSEAVRAPVPQPPPSSSPAAVLDRFLPRELADKLETARQSGTMVGERRVLTMLFCDVKGSTAAAEQLDPEEWTDVINGAFEHMIKPVYKYEGTVARLMGDAILAFFGAPIAHEDDPQRAVLSGLEIVEGIKAYQEEIFERYGFKIEARVGINTGLVVVGAVGSDLRMEYTAMGDAINLAARMEQTAEPGTVQIAAATYQLVNPLFEIEELGPVQIKGKAELVPVYRVIDRKAIRQSLRGIEGMRSRLVGRDREINTLHAILDRTQQGLGHIVCLTGDAGLGKSRLIAEAHDYWRSAGLSGSWQGVSSFSYETNNAYGLFQRLIRRLSNIGVTDSPAILRQKLEPVLAPFPLDRQPLIMQIFNKIFALQSETGLPPLDGEAFREELFRAMLQIWRHIFGDQPTVLVFDDLHWSDPASVQLLTHLLAATDTIPLVLICAFRADTQAPSAQLQETARQKFAHRYTDIQLKPLSDQDINTILDELLTIAELPQKLRGNILDRAGGNPFFVEEVLRSLVLNGVVVAEDKLVDGELQQVWRAKEGAQSVRIPDNLQGLLAARIDRLDEDIRATLQLASVIGRSFYERVLTEMAGYTNGAAPAIKQHLRQLLQLHMIAEAARIPQVEYIFRSPLTQEVAYNGILLKRRREFHQQVGLTMETLFAEQLTEMSPRLAYHFREAGQPQKAFHYYIMAADQARQIYALPEALAHYDQALALVDDAQPGGEQIIQLYLQRGRMLEHNGEFTKAKKNYETLASLGEKEGHKEMRLQALMANGTLYAMRTGLLDLDIAEQLAEEGLLLARELDNKEAEAKIQWNLMQIGRARGREGDTKKAIKHGEQSLALTRELNLPVQMARTLNDLAALYRYDTQIDKFRECAKAAREMFREMDNKPMLADSYGQSAHFFSLSGYLDEAEDAANKANQISSEIGNLWNLGISAFVLTLVNTERGHLAAALSVSSSTLDQVQNLEHPFIKETLRFRMIENFIEAGAWQQAQALTKNGAILDDISTMMREPYQAVLGRLRLYSNPNYAQEIELDMEPLVKTDAVFLAYNTLFRGQYQAELALAQGNLEFAVQKANESIAIIERFDIGILMPVFGLLLAKALWRQGDETAAQQALAEAETKARAIGSLRSLWPILVQKVEWEADSTLAESVHAEARAIIDTIIEHAGSPELQESFRNRAEVKKVFHEIAPGS